MDSRNMLNNGIDHQQLSDPEQKASKDMNWFIAKLIYEIITEGTDHKPQFDEQYRLIRAHSHDAALNRASDLGKREEDIFLNQKHSLVRWSFVNVTELFMVDELRDGLELFSTISDVDDGKDYKETAHLRAAYIRDRVESRSRQQLNV